MEDLTGKQFGPYQIVAPLGEGGMGAVYKAYQPAMERYVALKVLPRHFAEDPQFTARFGREAKTMAQLQHPHILPVFNYGQADGYTYIVMPFVQCGTLSDTLKGKPLPLFLIRKVITQLGDALNYAHSRGLIHRDIKPSNVLVDEGGNYLLTDFGLARKVETSVNLTTPGAIMGTPAYMSPEQGSGSRIDKRSDIYSLGVILYQMATGRVPYKAETPVAVIMKHIHDPLPSARTLNPELPDAVNRVILKALSKTAKNRYQTAGEMVRATQAAIPDASASPPPASMRTPTGTLVLNSPAALADKTLPTRAGSIRLSVRRVRVEKTPPTRPRKATAQAAKQAPRKRSSWSWGLPVTVVLAVAGGLFTVFRGGTPVAIKSAAAALPSTPSKFPLATTPQALISNVPQGAVTASMGKERQKDTPEYAVTRIPAGTNSGTDPDDGPYVLSLPEPLFMDACETSKSKWDDVYKWAVENRYKFSNSGEAKKPNHPVVLVNWFDCVKWCNARSEKEGQKPCYTVKGEVYRSGDTEPVCDFAASGYRLPTHDEWKYAMRGGLSGKRFPWGDTIQHSLANYRGNTNAYDLSQRKGYHPDYCTSEPPYTSPVGSFTPNGYGLYDMAGNVAEWCWNKNGTTHIVVGGDFSRPADAARCQTSWLNYPNIRYPTDGFRTVRRVTSSSN